MRFGIVCTTEREDVRLRIDEAQVIRKKKPAITRRVEETGIDFLTGTLPPEDKQICTAKQSETKESALIKSETTSGHQTKVLFVVPFTLLTME